MEYGLTSMMNTDLGGFMSFAFLAGLAWMLFWTGWALWIAARKGSKPWFIALLIINTFGILEILYIFIFSKWKNGEEKREEEIQEELIDEKEIQKEVQKEQEENRQEDRREGEQKTDTDNSDLEEKQPTTEERN